MRQQLQIVVEASQHQGCTHRPCVRLASVSEASRDSALDSRGRRHPVEHSGGEAAAARGAQQSRAVERERGGGDSNSAGHVRSGKPQLASSQSFADSSHNLTESHNGNRTHITMRARLPGGHELYSASAHACADAKCEVGASHTRSPGLTLCCTTPATH